MAKRKVKIPKPPKLPRPLARDLRSQYKKLISLSLENRIAALSMAIQWYLQALPYMEQKGLIKIPVMPPSGKWTNKKEEELFGLIALTTKTRALAYKNANLNEKEAALLATVRIYEKICSAIEPVPMDSYYKVYEARKDVLVQKQARLENKYGEALGLLQRAIGNKLVLNLADGQKPVQYDSHLRSISYNREAARKITEKYRKEGLLAAFLDQLDTFAQESALVMDGHGGYQYDAVRHVTAVKELLQAFLKFAKSNECPNRIVKKSGGVARAPKVIGQQPRVPGVRREKVAGKFSAGSSIAVVYERLKDEKEHDLDEILAGLTITDPFGTIRHLKWHGNRDKLWKVTVTGKKVQLKHSFPMAS